MSRAVLRWVPAALWAGFLLWLGQRGGGDLPATPDGFDKLFHAGAYGFLGALAAFGPRGITPLRGALIGLLAALLVGGADEWMQGSVEGRVGSLGDLVADVAGAAAGGWLIPWITAYNGRFLPDRNKRSPQ